MKPGLIILSERHWGSALVWISLFLAIHAWGATSVVVWGDGGATNVPVGLTNVVAIAANVDHCLALQSDGTLTGWDSASPVALSGPSDIVEVAAGWAHDVLALSDGTVVIYGGAMWPPSGLSNVVCTAAENDYSWALRSDGTLVGWSRFSNGGPEWSPLLTNGILLAASVDSGLVLKSDGGVESFGLLPSVVPADATNVAAIAEGWYHSLAARRDGTVVGWGNSVAPPGLSNIVAVAAGEYHSLALKNDGTVIAWNFGGALETNVPPGLSNVVAIAAGRSFNVALTNDGSLFISRQPFSQTVYRGERAYFRCQAMTHASIQYRWQRNSQDIPGATNDTLILDGIQPASAGNYNVVVSDGSGQLRSRTAVLTVLDGAPFIISQPTNQTILRRSTTAISTIARGSQPWHFQWQFNGVDLPGATDGALRFNSVQPSNSGVYRLVITNAFGSVTTSNMMLAVVPSLVIGWGDGANVPATATNIIAVSGGNGFSVALRADGKPIAWGDNTFQQTNVPGFLTNVVAISAGANQTLAVRTDGTIFGWGISYQDFPPSLPPNAGPLSVPAGLSNVVSVASGRYHGLALKRDGTVTAWGSIQSGSTYVSPAPDPNLVNVVAVAAGLDHCMALKKNGTVVAWGGRNKQGQTNVPPGLSNVVAIAAGQYHSLALKADGTVAVWGDQFWNEVLGMPAYLTNTVAIASGMCLHSLALSADGSLDSWGYQFSFPAGLTNIAGLAGSVNYSIGIINDGTPFFIRQPYDSMAAARQSITLSGAAAGKPPFSFQWKFNGTNLPGATSSSLSLSNLTTGQAGGYALAASNEFGTTVSSNAAVDVVDEARALNSTNLVWSNGGAVPWFWQDTVTHDGTAALRSGATNSGQYSTLQTTVTGPGTLTFWWKTSASYYPPSGSTTLSINGGAQANQSGEIDWNQKTLYLPAGPQLLDWTYARNSPNGGQDTAWLDQVNYVAGPTLPYFAVVPTNQAIAAGETVTLRAAALGTPLLQYQWQFNGADLAGRTATNLIFTNVQSSLAGTYTIAVTNPHGFASASASLTVAPAAPSILTQPSGGRFMVGNTVILRAAAKGSEPLNFQWQFNGADIQGATSSALALSNLQETNSGNYRVFITNAVAGLFSSNANLLVAHSHIFLWGDLTRTNLPVQVPDPAAVSAGGTHCVALRNDSTVVTWGSNTYRQTNSPAGLTNVVAIAAGGYHTLGLRNDGVVVAWGAGTNVTASPHFGQSIVPATLTNAAAVAGGLYHSLVLKNDGTVTVWGRSTEGQTAIPSGLSHVVAIAAGGYHNLAVKADGTVVAWGAGTNVGSAPARGQCIVPSGLSNVVSVAAGLYFSMALRSDGRVIAWGDNSFGQTNVPATLSNAVAIAAGDSHAIALTADANVICWGAGTNNLGFPPRLGQSIVPGNLSNFVAIAGGGLLSAAIVNDGTPFLASQPLSRVVSSGDILILPIVVASGSPLNYQWSVNGSALNDATNATLLMTNIPLTAGGTYQCSVSNALGAILSQPVNVTVVRSTPLFGTSQPSLSLTSTGFLFQLNGLSGHGPVVISASTNLADWFPIFTSPPTLGTLRIVDPNASNSPSRFYRAVEQ